ncbi:MetQ/NlpA family ABC transporter substrate-binding protein [Lactococcus hircilactis]|uniref:Lipoprotein n=1 Tax=Lactococcus hircilactis TaxID=1494462 RepID=A0A7X1Z8Z8_9LACT|nr:MetQ/NlpA family ABC transporter substrate-binding protein [Lactococcus hircilactis]MQW38700.1 MetQ/NlpA family ABC transporter substrate-binding protein [Lactococcus hircilactis]
MRTRRLIIGVIIALIVIIGAGFAFGALHKTKTNAKTVTLGIMPGGKQEDAIWKVVKANAKKSYGIDLQFVNFTDGDQPNKALASHDIDLNAFQHYAYLKSWNQSNHGDLVAIGDTIITPIHLYSTQYKSVDALPDGATIAIPNDLTNESRALHVLKNAGLITLNSSQGLQATVKDVKSNPKHLVIKEVDASQGPRTLPSVAAAVINYNFAQSAKIPASDSIFVEPFNADSHQWVNIIVANKKDRNKQIYKDIVSAYNSENVKATIEKEYPDGGEKAAWDLKF